MQFIGKLDGSLAAVNATFNLVSHDYRTVHVENKCRYPRLQ